MGLSIFQVYYMVHNPTIAVSNVENFRYSDELHPSIENISFSIFRMLAIQHDC